MVLFTIVFVLVNGDTNTKYEYYGVLSLEESEHVISHHVKVATGRAYK